MTALPLLALCLSATAAAQQLAFGSEVSSRRVEVGQTFQVVFTLTGARSGNLTPPDFEGLEVLSGPAFASSFSVGGGRRSASATYTFDVAAEREGTVTIGPATMRVGGKVFKSRSIPVRVSAATPPPPGTAPAASEEVAVRLRLERDTVYVGEPVDVRVDLLTRVQVRSYEALRPLRLGDLSSQALRNFDANARRVDVEGIAFSQQTLQAFEVVAPRAGVYEIGPVSIRANVATEGGRRRRSFFFSPRTRPVDARSGRRRLVVLPLPSPAPPDFSGLVGRWRFNVEYADGLESLTTADAVTASLVMQGRGDATRIGAPDLEWPEGWRVYPPELEAERDMETDTGYVFTRVYEYTLAPERSGASELRPTLSYFDTQTRRYERVVLPSARTRVAAAPGGDAHADIVTAAGDDDEVAEALPLIEGPGELPRAAWARYAWFWWTLVLGPAVALGAAMYRHWRRRRASAGPGAVGAVDPVAEGRRRLAAARADLADADAFYRAVRGALERYAEERLGLTPSEQTESALREAFARGYAGGDDGAADAERFLAARALADRGLYGGGTDEAGRRRALAELERLLSR